MSSSVEQIKSRLNIIDVVQGYVKLQKAGVNFKANCPFHSEKTPSFTVSPSRESFRCFGCGKSGDIFNFIMEIEGIEFVEALKILANKAGVEIEPIDSKQKNQRVRSFQIMDEARKFYQKELKKNQTTIDYLKNRGMSGETALFFGIGFAPNGWRNLCDFLKNKGYQELEIETVGLAIKKETSFSGHQNSYYDRFRNRIMFPIYNPSGQTVGFTARISPEQEAEGNSHGGKYINTPQTILYDKSRLLYGFEKAKQDIRKRDVCILVEGQMDVIMSHQAGFTNTVAVSGTALTKEHLIIIKRLTDNLIIAFDKDSAGIGAAGRGIDMALAEGFDIKVVVIPSGKDPADSIKENPEEWKKATTNAKNIIQFYFDLSKTRKEIEDKVLPYVAVLPSEMQKAEWVRKIAEKLKINEESVWIELKKVKQINLNDNEKEQQKLPEKAEKKNRLETLKDRLTGLILWQRSLKDKIIDQELEILINKTIEEQKIDLKNIKKEYKEKLIFEAELIWSPSDASINEEIKTLANEIRKEDIKMEILEITNKMREAELLQDREELNKYQKKLDSLIKNLNK